MFKIISAIKNNLSESKYLKNINNVEFKPYAESDKDSNDKFDGIDEAQVLEDINKLQDEVRHENLRIFGLNMFRARGKQFLIVSLPAILTAATVLLWVSPAKRVKTESLDTYKRVDTVICDNRQLEIEDPKLYYSTFMGRTYVDEDKAADYTSSYKKRLELYITENLEGFLASINISSDGSLSISDIDSGTYLNLNEYNFEDGTELDSKYASMFDTVVKMMLESGYINDEERENLKKLSESDKKEIVATIVEYENIGKTDVEVYKSNWFWRIALTVITGIYLWVLGYIRKEDGPWEFYELHNNNGELVESDYAQEIGLFYIGTKYKQAFLAAERDRIKKIYELADKNLIGVSRDSILTEHEKKLTIGPRRDR